MLRGLLPHRLCDPLFCACLSCRPRSCHTSPDYCFPGVSHCTGSLDLRRASRQNKSNNKGDAQQNLLKRAPFPCLFVSLPFLARVCHPRFPFNDILVVCSLHSFILRSRPRGKTFGPGMCVFTLRASTLLAMALFAWLVFFED